jgi:uncharacterized protein
MSYRDWPAGSCAAVRVCCAPVILSLAFLPISISLFAEQLRKTVYFSMLKPTIMATSLLGYDETPVVQPVSDEKTMALLSHVITFVSNFIAPLIIYMLKKDESSFVAAHAKESLNFQLTILLIVIALVLSVVGILLLWLVGIYTFVLVIVATIRASEGKLYRYPFCIRFIK